MNAKIESNDSNLPPHSPSSVVCNVAAVAVGVGVGVEVVDVGGVEMVVVAVDTEHGVGIEAADIEVVVVDDLFQNTLLL